MHAFVVAIDLRLARGQCGAAPPCASGATPTIATGCPPRSSRTACHYPSAAPAA
jgi:hypothetical protein